MSLFVYEWHELAKGRKGISVVSLESKTAFSAWLRRMNKRGGRVLSYLGVTA